MVLAENVHGNPGMFADTYSISMVQNLLVHARVYGISLKLALGFWIAR